MTSTRLSRTAVTAFTAVALLWGCGPVLDDAGPAPAVQPTTAAEGGTGDASPGQAAGPTAAGPGDSDPTGGGPTGAGTDGGGDGGSQGGGDQGPPAASTDDLGGVGANGRAYLRPDHPSLIVEIDVQDGVSPGEGPLDHLVATIRQHADKPGGVQFAGSNSFSSDRREWSRDDLRAAADEHRQHYSDDQAVVLYLLYVRGGFYQDGERTNAIGVTYNASEVALFPDRWSGLGNLIGSGENVERAVLVHEFGHALGLVNITYASDIDHEDPEHPKHSSNRQSVMYYAVESTLVGQVFDGPPPAEFDDADIADIEGLKSGRY